MSRTIWGCTWIAVVVGALPLTAAAAPAEGEAALVAGKLPEGAPEVPLLEQRCRNCHVVDYVTQQRLSEGAWKKTIDKMRRFGAEVSDAEAGALVGFLSRTWSPELAERSWEPVGLPPGALPLRAPRGKKAGAR